MVVDDSRVFRHFLTWILSSDPSIEVVGAVHDGYEAVKQVEKLNPDLITIDLNMPGINGYETTRQLMEVFPVPIIIVSGLFHSSEVSMTFNSLKAGALAVLPKPEGIEHPNHKESSLKFLKMVKTMAEVKVVRRLPGSGKTNKSSLANKSMIINTKIIAIGASAGGPPVLQEILSGINPEFKIPIIIVQHIDPFFAESFCNWLRDTTKRNIMIGQDKQIIQEGTIYLPPSDSHITVSEGGYIKISKDKPEHSCRPSVSYLFRGILEQYGKYSMGIILTGMGKDGAKELSAMFESGCHTIVQEPSTALVNGMPGEAIRLNAASQILSPAQIAKYLNLLYI